MTTTPALRASFDRLVAEWQQHLASTSHIALPYAAIDCPAFEELARLGQAILPLVFARYEEDVPWSALLFRLVPEAGLGEGLTSDVERARQSWLVWGRERGFAGG